MAEPFLVQDDSTVEVGVLGHRCAVLIHYFQRVFASVVRTILGLEYYLAFAGVVSVKLIEGHTLVVLVPIVHLVHRSDQFRKVAAVARTLESDVKVPDVGVGGGEFADQTNQMFGVESDDISLHAFDVNLLDGFAPCHVNIEVSFDLRIESVCGRDYGRAFFAGACHFSGVGYGGDAAVACGVRELCIGGVGRFNHEFRLEHFSEVSVITVLAITIRYGGHGNLRSRHSHLDGISVVKISSRDICADAEISVTHIVAECQLCLSIALSRIGKGSA